ncbi:MAG: hypothetical protein IKP09_09790 [Lentisphaeria bacterium]|nr:hypothetical protein [Lentisphaeria bacterium]
MVDPEMALALTKTCVPVIDSLIKACIESKRLDVELEALRTNAELGRRRLALQEKELMLRHQETMKIIEDQTKIMQRRLDLFQKEIEKDEKKQIKLFELLEKLNDRIIDKNTSKEEREGFLRGYEITAQLMISSSKEYGQTFTAMIQNTNAQITTKRIPSSGKHKQLISKEDN